MAVSKKKSAPKKKHVDNPNVIGLHSEVLEQPITQTLEVNYMPYAMSTNVSRAFPEIDGFKPSHRKLLYTMYKMGLLNGARQKSANIVGQTMKLNPHGDAAIYETMVRLASGNEALLTPFVESKGNFGKYYSGDLSYAASRYTEAKLSPICAEVFKDIDKDPVDFVDSYDGAMQEPRLLPTAFPNVLVSANKGIGVAMASDICGFNLNEVCDATMHFLKDPDYDLFQSMPAPDFSTGGELIYKREEMERVYNTGLGGFQLRSRWRYLPDERIIEIYEIPYTTKTDVIIDRIIKLSKEGKVREISDIRDETDLSGLRIAIDVKRGTDPEQLMGKLFQMTTLQDTFSCNFNVLVDGYPKVMGVREILTEWVAWRVQSTRRRVQFDLNKKTEKLHLLHGLEAILLDIDKAVDIIRHTELEVDVVPNLMKGFNIDQVQAEYVANIRLRNINREYILNRTKDIETLDEEIAKLNEILSSDKNVKKVIYDELAAINKKYVTPRKTGIVAAEEIVEVSLEPEIEDYPVTIMVSKEGYLKKLTDRVLRSGADLKYKDGDSVWLEFPSANKNELMVLTDKSQCYKLKVSTLSDTKSADLGTFLPTELELEDGENIIYVLDPGDYSNDVLYLFRNGRAARVALAGYKTKQNRKKLKNAIYVGSPLIGAIILSQDQDVTLLSNDNRMITFNTSLLKTKTTNNTQGLVAFTCKNGREIIAVGEPAEFLGAEADASHFVVAKLPSPGIVISDGDRMTLFDM
ncbi:DNA gyrase subunit A [Denitrobacterium detoxificans]|jgi:DNA gyrase subunit A|uniref:DNA gyrase subunit A n=1 Tax=Denitrobacterium detoxificans TaxID=79604 RepID=UPI0026F11BD8|nr:DNA gyrase subunit A [Denitrobacterium detoxificans]MBE6465505.1 topoisomerase IV [Denitrobacterium detoxificans]